MDSTLRRGKISTIAKANAQHFTRMPSLLFMTPISEVSARIQLVRWYLPT